MIINKLKIVGLFEQFNYTIAFNTEEQLTIITGPNGYGKTMILNIIFNFFNRRFYFFQNLVFKKIEFYLDNDFNIEITKKKENVSSLFIEEKAEEKEKSEL